jgi:hypothetical protein
MVSTGIRIAQQKRTALADCNGLLERLSGELERLVERGRDTGLDVYELEDVTPLTQRVVMLRGRRERLEDELRAITAEWTD